MNLRDAASLTFVCLLLAATLAAGTDSGKPMSVIGAHVRDQTLHVNQIAAALGLSVKLLLPVH